MLQELTAQTNAAHWAVGSLLFFVGVYVVVTFKVFRTRPEVLDARARLAIDDGDAGEPTRAAAAGRE